MNDCSHCWERYMDATALSHQTRDPKARDALIRTAYTWLQRYFDAEERELARRGGVFKTVAGRLYALWMISRHRYGRTRSRRYRTMLIPSADSRLFGCLVSLARL